MADIYADGQLGTGANNGTSWVNAYQGEAGLQAACDAAVAGDILHITRTFTLTALTVSIDIDIASGSQSSPIRVIGYNYNSGSPVVDGTRSIIDADNAAVNCVAANGVHYWVLENIEFKNATDDNVTATVDEPLYWIFINCISHHAGADGWGETAAISFLHAKFIICNAYNNIGNGFKSHRTWDFGCVAHDNGAVGFYAWRSKLINCLSYKNVTFGIYLADDHCAVRNCVIDNNLIGININDIAPIYACRITNNTTGIAGDATTTVIDFWNFFKDNTVNIDAVIGSVISTFRGEDTRVISGETGYMDSSNGDYRLNRNATSRRMQVEL